MQGFYSEFRNELAAVARSWSAAGTISPNASPDDVSKALLAVILGSVVQAVLLGEFDGRARRGYDHRGRGLPRDHDLPATGCRGRDPDRARSGPLEVGRSLKAPVKVIAYALKSKLPLFTESPRVCILGNRTSC